jgi:uncharacterized protein (DUF169 family)
MSQTAKQLKELLGLRTAPIGVTFRETPPQNVARIADAAPSGCTYWKRAAEGLVFYTEASDHYNCPVGAYTHGIELPPEKATELEGLVGTMVSLEYIRLDEVPSIPQRAEQFGVAIYAPLADAPCEADVVLVRGNAKQMMLLAEAVNAAGIGAEGSVMGRPTCAAIPAVLQSGRGVTNLGCIGNRVYTGLADDEFYFALPGARVGDVVAKLATIIHANNELEAFHRART